MNQQKAKTSYKYDFIFSLTLLHIQRNPQHSKIKKQRILRIRLFLSDI